jgi:hypothetical protein
MLRQKSSCNDQCRNVVLIDALFHFGLFAFSCAPGLAYGFLPGAWPFGLVEAVWSLVAGAAPAFGQKG